MVKKINHEQLGKLIDVYYKAKKSLLIYGTFGIGKSEVTRETAREIAKQKAREFVEWNKLTREEKQKVYEYPEKYFVLMDIRLSEFDSSDIKGLPDFQKERNFIEWKIPFFCKLLEKEESDGLLFFDEMNLATPLVISSCYKIIYDRVVNEGKIGHNWLIMGCGNLADDKAYTHDLAPPVRDRGGEVELQTPSIDKWCEWAINNKIDSRIIGFLNFKPSNLHNVNFDDEQKFTTERGWARASDLIKDIKDYQVLELVSASAISEGIAKEFTAFCKIKEQINLKELLKNPSRLKEIKEISIKYFIITALADRYGNKKAKFNDILKVSKILDEDNNVEFVSLLWRLAYRYGKEQFKKDYTNTKMPDEMKDKYTRYIYG